MKLFSSENTEKDFKGLVMRIQGLEDRRKSKAEKSMWYNRTQNWDKLKKLGGKENSVVLSGFFSAYKHKWRLIWDKEGKHAIVILPDVCTIT